MNVFPLTPSSSKFIRYFRRAVEHRDRKTLRFHVQGQVLAHDRKANQSNITLIRIHFVFQYLKEG
jgi:hypothetical protein